MNTVSRWLWACAASALLATCLQAGEEGGRNRESREGRGGKPFDRMRKMQEDRLPGAKEANAAFEAQMKAIGEKARTLADEIRAAVKAAEGKEAKQAVVKNYEPKIRALATEMVDTRFAHDQKILDLKKANREAEIEAAFGRMKKAGKGPMGKGGMQNRGEGNEMPPPPNDQMQPPEGGQMPPPPPGGGQGGPAEQGEQQGPGMGGQGMGGPGMGGPGMGGPGMGGPGMGGPGGGPGMGGPGGGPGMGGQGGGPEAQIANDIASALEEALK